MIPAKLHANETAAIQCNELDTEQSIQASSLDISCYHHPEIGGTPVQYMIKSSASWTPASKPKPYGQGITTTFHGAIRLEARLVC